MHSQTVAQTVSKILAEKRDNERVKSAFSAIISEHGQFRCHCIIRDVSKKGMRLEIPETFEKIEEFDLRTPAMPETLPVRCVWRRHNLMGVEFVFSDLPADEEVSGSA